MKLFAQTTLAGSDLQQQLLPVLPLVTHFHLQTNLIQEVNVSKMYILLKQLKLHASENVLQRAFFGKFLCISMEIDSALIVFP